MSEKYNDQVLDAFLAQQDKLYPEAVASDREEAEQFLQESMAVVADSLAEVMEYMEEAGADISGMDEKDIAEAEEVFAVGDGRYLVLEI